MNPFDVLFKGVREALVLSNEVQHLATDVKELARDIRDHERRLSRIEGMIEFARRPADPQSLPPGDQRD